VTHGATGAARHNKDTKLNKWNEQNMLEAISECQSTNISVRKASFRWSVPRTTLQSRLSGKVKENQHSSGRKPVLNETVEAELVVIIKLMAQRGFPLGMREIRSVAYQYASQNRISGFSEKKKLAGYDWFVGFAKRHHDIGVRKPEALSVARASGMNRPVIAQWFEALSGAVSSMGIENMPGHYWNVDETGLQDYFVPSKPKVIGETG